MPLWSGGGQAVFVQPGFVFWTGLADEERIDGNLGIAYRTGLTKDVIGGASIFYDRDFKQGHSRVSFGADVQSGFFHGAANYYQPLSDEEDGREGFVEEALRGMDFRLAVQRDIMRVSGNLGYWRFEGDDSVEADWKISYGLDAGVRVFPGVFIEGGWERHDEDVSLDSRWNAGLAFRFSLPDFRGASYGDGSMSSNLYQIVEREKRILYEERVAGPTISIIRTGSETIAAGEEVTIAVDIQLSEALQENVTINLVGSGSATYNDDWIISVGGTDCTGVTDDDCQVAIDAGETSVGEDVAITINSDGLGESAAETIIISMEIASIVDTDLMLGNSSLLFTIPADPPVPTVSLNYSGSGDVEEGNTVTMTVVLSRALNEEVVVNLVGTGSTATYGLSNDWQLNNGTTDCNGVTGMTCQVTIDVGETSADVNISVLDDMSAEGGETITVTINIATAGSTGLVPGSSTSQSIDIPPHLPTVSLSYSGSRTVETFDAPEILVSLSEALSQAVTLNIVPSGTARYGGNWSLGRRSPTESGNYATCSSLDLASCQVTIAPGDTTAQIRPIASSGDGRTMTVTISIPIESMSLVQLGSTPSVTLNIGGASP